MCARKETFCLQYLTIHLRFVKILRVTYEQPMGNLWASNGQVMNTPHHPPMFFPSFSHFLIKSWEDDGKMMGR